MNTMDIPGFSAEASLYVSRECYRAPMSMPDYGQVIPQARFDCLIGAPLDFLVCAIQGWDPQYCIKSAGMWYDLCETGHL